MRGHGRGQDTIGQTGQGSADQGEALIAALILYVAIEAPPNARHMRTVYALLVELGKDGGKEIDKLFDSLADVKLRDITDSARYC